MSDWWEQAYAGGPMVAVKGFPRPLYPPDANEHGKKASSDGPDVIAYKRTVSRAGRWPWQTFDDAYSNGFAHGSGPNVIDTGVAGVQRQQHIEPSGWLGQATFNTLRSIRVPEGKPHAGEMAMDAAAVELINEAFDIFGGHEPPDDPGTVRLAALSRAKSQVGYTEAPAGSNMTKFGAWYGVDGQPWCAMFTTWCFEYGAADIGKDSPTFVRGSRYAYVPYIVADAYAGLNGLSVTDTPQPGDLAAYDWDWDSTYDHTGIFSTWTGPTSFEAVEGNTSMSNQSNGGAVMLRKRDRTAQRTVFIRVKEPA